MSAISPRASRTVGGPYSTAKSFASHQVAHQRSASDPPFMHDEDRQSLDLRPLGMSSSPMPWPEVRLPVPSHSPSNSMTTLQQPHHSTWHTASSWGSERDWPTATSGRRPDVSVLVEDPPQTSGGTSVAGDKARSSPETNSAPSPPQRRTFDGTWCGANGRLAFLAHWMGLVFAERPMTSHRQWMGLSQKASADGTPGAEPKARGGLKRRLLLGMGSSHRRFIPLENLEEQYAGNRKRRRLMYALRRHHTPGSYRNKLDALCNEAFIALQLLFDRCTPRRLREHPPWFSAAYLALTFVTFAFMAGEYPAYLGTVTSEDLMRWGVPSNCSFGTGPGALAQWVWRWDDCHTFEGDFLVKWGATWAPKVNSAKQWWRWFSSCLLADSFPHVASNALLFGVVGLHCESRFTTRAVGILVVLAGLGGNFFDAAFRGACTVIISAAGCSFGLMGLFMADFILNFENIRFPVPRLVAFLISLLAFILAAAVLGYPYRLTPIGGFLTGLFPSLLVLPHVRSEMFEWCIPLVALVTTLGCLLALPLYIYLVRFPNMPPCA